jgi:beta-glucosidase
VSFVKGLQGNDPTYLKIISTVKHYVVHSGPEELRHEFNTIASERDFWESYMPHFITSIKEANVQSVMCAYSRLNGESCCGSDYLMNDLLRNRLGFKGYIVSDCGSVSDIYDGHHLVESFQEAALLALESGVDLNCGRAMTFPFDELADAVGKGMVDEAQVDSAISRLMLARFRLGMFDPPELVPYAGAGRDVIDSPENKVMALEMARESIVLLKNEDHLLPLDKGLAKIAVIGPNAYDHRVLYGNYNGLPSQPVSILEGIQKKVPESEVLYSKGSELVSDNDFFTPVPSYFLKSPEGEEGLQASYYPNTFFSGDPLHKRTEKGIMLFDEFGPPFADLREGNFSVCWEGFLTFPETARYKITAEARPNYKIYIDDELIASTEKDSRTLKYEENRPYKFRAELVCDADEFYMILAHAVDETSLKRNALKIAREADAVILVVGTSSLLEEEGNDREEIELPGNQQQMIRDVLELKKPVVLVVLGGSPIAFDEDVLKVPAIVEAWYPGQSGGTAVADVLFGDYNPAGRLPVTFPRSTSQLPPYEDYSMQNRTYKYFREDPLFPFGYGLSYSTFAYDHLNVPETIRAGENLEISVEVENTGRIAGDEVVQVYISDTESSVRTPRHSLQAFERIHLAPGERRTMTFSLTPKQMALLTDDMEWMVEPGKFEITVGGGQPGIHCPTSETRSGKVVVVGEPFHLSLWE